MRDRSVGFVGADALFPRDDLPEAEAEVGVVRFSAEDEALDAVPTPCSIFTVKVTSSLPVDGSVATFVATGLTLSHPPALRRSISSVTPWNDLALPSSIPRNVPSLVRSHLVSHTVSGSASATR